MNDHPMQPVLDAFKPLFDAAEEVKRMTQARTNEKTCTTKQVQTDVYIRLDPNIHYWRGRTPERWLEMTEEWLREFEGFLRDHRSQDEQSMRVVREIETQCSECNREWDPYEDEGVTRCGYCGAILETSK